MSTSPYAMLVWGVDLGAIEEMDEELQTQIDFIENESESKVLDDAGEPTGCVLESYGHYDYLRAIIRPASQDMFRTGEYEVLALNPYQINHITGIEMTLAQKCLDAGMRALGLEPRPGAWLLAAELV